MVSVVSSNPTGDNFIFLRHLENDRNVRFVLFTKTSSCSIYGGVSCPAGRALASDWFIHLVGRALASDWFIHLVGRALASDWFIHLVGRALTSDWFIHLVGRALASDWFIHLVGRALASDWFASSCIVVVYENFSQSIFFVQSLSTDCRAAVGNSSCSRSQEMRNNLRCSGRRTEHQRENRNRIHR